MSYVQSRICNELPQNLPKGVGVRDTTKSNTTKSKQEYNQHSANTVSHFLHFVFKLVWLTSFNV